LAFSGERSDCDLRHGGEALTLAYSSDQELGDGPFLKRFRESDMNNQIRVLSPTKQPNGERANASSLYVETELGDAELSQVSGGRLICAQGQHIKTGRITC
jgi:hypothetical protein